LNNSLVSHVGIAVKDLKASVKVYSILTGDHKPVIENVPSENVEVAVFSGKNKDSGRVELVAATSESSPIAKFISKHGEGLHHICIIVEDINSKLAELRKAGIKLIDQNYRPGAEGKRIAFVHPEHLNGVLIELEEK
jgi:methylmalonyl-CoA/ethylmalonyl-CoA epimerase